jgi:MFS family permease
MPYILLTLPLTAICFSAIPFAALKSLVFLIIVIFLLNVFKQAARGPVVALMPDMIPGEYRSEANGVINTMGGIAAIVGTVGLAKLMDTYITLPGLGRVKDILPFPIAGILVILATLLLFLFIKEKQTADAEKAKRTPVLQSMKMIFSAEDKSAFWILLSILLWFFGYQGVLPFIGLYSVEFIGTSTGTAALAGGMVGIAYAIFAIPSGIIAHKAGRKKTIRVSLLVLTGLLILIYFHHPISLAFKFNHTLVLVSFWGIMFLFGMFWVAVITNSFPMLWQMATYSDMGIYTGLYYTFSQAAAILSPPVAGGLIDGIGYRAIFLFAAACMFAAFMVMGLVKQGETWSPQQE